MESTVTVTLTLTEIENLRRAVSFTLANCSEVKDLFFGIPPEPTEQEFDRLRTLLQGILDEAS